MILKTITLSAVMLTATLSFTAFAHEGATGIVKERMDRFKASKQSMKDIKTAYANNDFAMISSEAALLADWAKVIPEYFPENSNEGPTEASWHIWHMFDDFKLKSAAYQKAAEQLKLAADAGDTDAVKTAFGSVAKSCKACHDMYKE